MSNYTYTDYAFEMANMYADGGQSASEWAQRGLLRRVGLEYVEESVEETMRRAYEAASPVQRAELINLARYEANEIAEGNRDERDAAELAWVLKHTGAEL